MPQIRKGGKFVFGWCTVRPGGTLQLPPQVLQEYPFATEGRVLLISGSRHTGGLCLSTVPLLKTSIMRGVFKVHPALANYTAPTGALLPYKGRLYGWCPVSPEGSVGPAPAALQTLGLATGVRLLAIRSSNIAITLGQRGTLIEAAQTHSGSIPIY